MRHPGLAVTSSRAPVVRMLAALRSPVLGPWGGVVADRLDLRRLLLATQVTFALLAAVLWVLAPRGQVGVGWLVMISLATGLVSVVDGPARQTFGGVLVPPGELARLPGSSSSIKVRPPSRSP
jgi:nitrate/nitrite transporter NarK